MAIQEENIGHSELVGAGETALHSHVGGSSIEMDSGQIVAIAKAETQVNFNITFAAIPMIFITPWADASCWLVEVTTTYFKFDNGKPSGTLMVDWIGVNI